MKTVETREDRARKAEEFLVLNERVRRNEATQADHERWLSSRADLLGSEAPKSPGSTPGNERQKS